MSNEFIEPDSKTNVSFIFLPLEMSRAINKVVVYGSGLMGRGIVQITATAGRELINYRLQCDHV